MKSNLAHELIDPQGEVVHFPKKERQAMSKKEEGFTPLPNFICDEGYLAVLSGESIKCLILLNRHIHGFHEKNKAIGEALVMKLTGFKDKRTVRKNMAELAKFKLVQITKTLGKATTYSVTFDDRLSPELVTSNDTSALNVVTLDATSVVTSDATSTSDIKCHSVKEIYLNKNLNKTHTQDSPQKIETDSWKPNLDLLNSILRTTKYSQRVSEILGMIEFEFHLGNFNAHWEDKITLTENQKTRKFAAWLVQEFEKLERKANTSAKQTNFNSKPKTALQATRDQWAEERFAQQQSSVIDVNQDQVLIGGEREYF